MSDDHKFGYIKGEDGFDMWSPQWATLAVPLTFVSITPASSESCRDYTIMAPGEAGVYEIAQQGTSNRYVAKVLGDEDAEGEENRDLDLGTHTMFGAIIAAQKYEDLFVARGMSSFALQAFAFYCGSMGGADEAEVRETCIKVRQERLDAMDS